MRRTMLAVAGIAFVLALPTPSHATLNTCAALKKKCVSKKTAALLKCHVSAEKSGADPTTDPFIQACLQKARDRFDGGAVPAQGCFAKLEAKYQGGCLTSNDTGAIENKVDAFVVDVVTEVDPSYPAAVQNDCSAGKKKCVAKKAAALLKCHYRNEKAPGIDPTKFAACVQKAEDRFDGGSVPSKGCVAKLEAKFPGG